MDNLSKPRVAIVCDWLTGYGGAERVVLQLHHMFPEAPIYTSQYDPKAIDWFLGADVRTSWLQHLPKNLRKFLPLLRAWAFSRLDLSAYDLVISSSGAEAKFIKKTKAGAKHICYCHSPTHYYWIRYDEYIKNPGFGRLDWLARIGLRILISPMRQWDYKAAQRPDVMLANSSYTKDNIKKYYGRDSTVIYPPVDIERFMPSKPPLRNDYVTAGRQTPYKRIDLAVAACTKLNLPLMVIGEGPEHKKLMEMAGPTVKFLTNVTDSDLPKYFQQAKAFIMPGKEDFGIIAIEALAAGTPVIAYKAGGALDYVITGHNGQFFEDQTPQSLTAALQHFDSSNYSSKEIEETIKKFSGKNFKTAVSKLL